MSVDRSVASRMMGLIASVPQTEIRDREVEYRGRRDGGSEFLLCELFAVSVGFGSSWRSPT